MAERTVSRIAVDFLGGDDAPASVADAIALFLSPAPGVVACSADLIVVGPVDLARSMLRERGVSAALEAEGRLTYVQADEAADMAAEALPAVRSTVGLTATVAAGLVSSGAADAWVSAGHSGAAVAASALAIGRLPGMPLPALAVVLPALHGPVLLADAGATSDVSPEVLLSFALAGAAYGRCMGIGEPLVGLLTIGSEAGKGDRLRKSAHDLLSIALPDAGIGYAGPVEGHDVPLGSRANVIVTDGFTGNVLLKGIEGTVRWAAARMAEAYGDGGPAASVAREVATSEFAGGVILGIDAVAVVGHGAGTAPEISACLRLADRAVRAGAVSTVAAALAPLERGPGGRP